MDFNSFKLPDFNLSKSIDCGKLMDNIDLRNYQLADYQYEVILQSIRDFESNLNDSQEVALKLTNFGQTIIINITSIGYSNPCLIHYYGYVNESYVELIQHVSQINFLLMAMPKDNPDRPTRRIGFMLEDESALTSDADNL